LEILLELWKVVIYEVGRLWWFTLIGIGLAALIKTQQWDKNVRVYIGRFGFWAIPVATLIGVLSPLCSCGILPVVIPMALTGVPLAPLMALLMTSPIMDPTSFMLTMSGVGAPLAWWKLGGAIALGLSSGAIVWAFEKNGIFHGNILRLKPVYNEDGSLKSGYEIGRANGLLLKTMTITPRDSKLRFFFDRFCDVGMFVALWVMIAIVLEAVIHVFVPIAWVTGLAGTKGVTSVVVAALGGLPLPANQISIVPILAGLKAKGMVVGADLAFLMAGPVTSIPAIIALWAIFIPRVVVTFVAIGLVGSIFLGLARMAFG
jgi:uncharacterized membrane protein YraQ (UPF0718 family)